jgi:pimeloyl-ACP methyl ester carboxylesterase
MAVRSRLMFVVLTLWFVALFSSLPLFAQPAAPHSFRVEVTGRGRPMILIPGLASSGDTWKSTVARYKDRYECHVLTLAGFAGVPAIPEPLLASVRAEIVAYVRERRLDHPIVIGHSLGGTIALAMAADHPDVFGSLVIVDSLPFLGGTALQVKTVDEARPGIAAMRAYMGAMTQAQWDQYARSGASVKYMVTGAADLETVMQWSVASDRRTVTESLADLYGVDVRQDIARIKSPTLMLGTWKGQHDQLMAQKIDVPRAEFIKTFSEQFAKLPTLHFVLSDTSRHFIMFDDPSWFFEQLDAFLANPDLATRTRE